MRKIVRESKKSNIYFTEHSIKKSNELSIAKMNQGLTLNQMQLFAYAIFSTQKDGKTEFRKHEFEKKFDIAQIRPTDAMDDAYRLLDLKIQMKDTNEEKSRGHNVFTDYFYDRGKFSFKWNDSFIPHILELKEKYIITDLKMTSKFKSSFSWILYEYLKGHYGYWYIEHTKSELMNLFCVEKVKSYQNNTSIFKNKVLDVAIKDINLYTELEVWYKEVKKGRKITGFLISWATGKQQAGATEKQLNAIYEIYNEVDKNMRIYFTLESPKRLELARDYIIRLNNIQKQINKDLTVKQAKEIIKEVKYLYTCLQKLIENDNYNRDTSFYYDWINED